MPPTPPRRPNTQQSTDKMAPKKAKAQTTSVLGDVGAKPSVDHAATAQKLQTLLDGFEPFDDAMREETRLRREKDARKIAAMKAEMSRLEGLLRDQVAITDSQQRSLQKHCDAELVKAYQAFAELLEHQDVEVHKRLDTYDKAGRCAGGALRDGESENTGRDRGRVNDSQSC